ncbi:hypothetical protein ABE10_00490, partial [Bacillus toyonensis]|nr:hypothetical protein [Bacillus toyonensis]
SAVLGPLFVCPRGLPGELVVALDKVHSRIRQRRRADGARGREQAAGLQPRTAGGDHLLHLRPAARGAHHDARRGEA